MLLIYALPMKTIQKAIRFDDDLWRMITLGAKTTRLGVNEFARQAIRRGAPALVRSLAGENLSPLTAAEWRAVEATQDTPEDELAQQAAARASRRHRPSPKDL